MASCDGESQCSAFWRKHDGLNNVAYTVDSKQYGPLHAHLRVPKGSQTSGATMELRRLKVSPRVPAGAAYRAAWDLDPIQKPEETAALGPDISAGDEAGPVGAEFWQLLQTAGDSEEEGEEGEEES